MDHLQLDDFEFHGEYYSHKFGNEFEVCLERYGANDLILAVYQNQRLLLPKYRCKFRGKFLMISPHSLEQELQDGVFIEFPNG